MPDTAVAGTVQLATVPQLQATSPVVVFSGQPGWLRDTDVVAGTVMIFRAPFPW
jgi:hypothetical protein